MPRRLQDGHVRPHASELEGRDGRDEACRRTGTCPKIINLNSSNEYWSKAGSLLHTDPSGRWDAVEPPNVRTYLLSSVEHTVIGNPADSPGVCAVARNTIDRAKIDRLIRRHLTQLQKPGVLTVRPGWEVTSHALSGRPAIVVTVERKQARVTAAAPCFTRSWPDTTTAPGIFDSGSIIPLTSSRSR